MIARAFLVTLVAATGLALTAVARAEWLSDRQSIMTTTIIVELWHENRQQGKKAIAAVMEEMHRINAKYSTYIDDSDLSIVNRDAASGPQTVSEELYFLLDKSVYISRISGGAFDITYASLGHHYDYREQVQPSEEQRKALLPAINYKWIALDPQKRTVMYKHKNVRVDMGAIAKGYAVDQGIEILKQHGVRHGMVSAGGESRLLGRPRRSPNSRRGRPWIVGIKNPREEKGGDATVLRIPLDNISVSTSGDYERYFIDQETDERIHHIINPRTGKSAREVMSVTVIGELSVDADPLSTAVFVMGVERGLALLNQLPGFDGIIIDGNGKVHYSDGLVEPN